MGSLRLGYIGRSLPLQNIPLEEIEVILLESRVISHKNCYKKNNLFTLHTCSDILSHRWWLPLTYTYAFLMMLSAKSVLELRNFGDEAFSPQKGVLKKVFFLRDTDTEASIHIRVVGCFHSFGGPICRSQIIIYMETYSFT